MESVASLPLIARCRHALVKSVMGWSPVRAHVEQCLIELTRHLASARSYQRALPVTEPERTSLEPEPVSKPYRETYRWEKSWVAAETAIHRFVVSSDNLYIEHQQHLSLLSESELRCRSLDRTQDKLLAELRAHREARDDMTTSLRSCENRLQQTIDDLAAANDQLHEASLTLAKLQGEKNVIARQVMLGSDELRPAVTFKPLADAAVYERAAPVTSDITVFANAALQAIPNLFVAGVFHTRKLMEVVIQGDLVRAASDPGFRAWAVDGTGQIIEHAHLVSPSALQSLVNISAVWSLASVAVGQMHLVDIARKLSKIESKLDAVREFLHLHRRTEIEGMYEYLRKVVIAIENGDRPSESIRFAVEACEMQLDKAQRNLIEEFQLCTAAAVLRRELAGTADYTTDLIRKFEDLGEIAAALDTCFKTRVLSVFVLSLYSGEASLKRTRKNSIQESLPKIKDLVGRVDKRLDEDLLQLNSFWNSDAKLEMRRDKARSAATVTKELIAGIVTGIDASMLALTPLLEAADEVTRLVVEVEGNDLVGVRQIAFPN